MGGLKQRNLKRITVLFLKLRFENTKNNAITQVSQGILSTIVGLPISVINWIIDFLSNRLQRIKLAKGCLSEGDCL